ncbi:condensation domain-containing protein, partial [Streptomyces sioyaensis]|uniref:condensation domain-containing protein n=1 Tax=Streptomyces sioyaensis TaxID=67364 RepID=UPI0037AE0C1C
MDIDRADPDFLKEVLDIWSSVLSVPAQEVSPDDDFFAAGGSSLLAARIQLLLRERLGVTVPLSRLLDAPTPRGMASLAAELPRVTAVETEAERDGDAPDRGRLGPLSSGQERLWFMHQLKPQSAFYNVPLAIRLRGELDLPALTAALDALLVRHEVLRTRITADEGHPVADIIDVQAELPLTDLSGLPGPDREREVTRLSEAAARLPFDLAAGPLLRSSLLRLSATEHVLVLVAHHIAYDAASQRILFDELTSAYRAARGGGAGVVAEPLPAQFGDFADWQRREAGSPAAARQLAYWKGVLADAPEASGLPPDHPRPSDPTFAGAVHRFALPQDLPPGVLALAREHRATPFMVLLAAFSSLLGAYSESEDVVIGVPAMNRGASRFQELIGFFINTLPLRCDLSGDPSFADLIDRVRETCISAYEHQDVPFEALVDHVRPRRDLSRAPIVQVLASWEEESAEPVFEGLETTVSGIPTQSSKLDLSLFLRATADGVSGAVEYATDLYDARTIGKFADGFVATLTAAVRAPHTKLSALPLLSAQERDHILHRWNPTPTPHTPTTIHDLITQQAHRTPNATAIHTPTHTLTYHQLLTQAHHLAATLQHHGTTPHHTIGILAPRTPHLITALLATLLTGAHYTPLDPDYPPQRLTHIINTTHITTLLTHPPHPHITTPHHTTTIPITTPHNPTHTYTPPTTHPHDLAYIIHTSGSTGTPKG